MQLLIDTREYRACNRHDKYFNIKSRIKLEVSILFNSPVQQFVALVR